MNNQYLKNQIETLRNPIIVTVCANYTGKSKRIKYICTPNCHLINIKITVEYDKFGEDYGIKSHNVKVKRVSGIAKNEISKSDKTIISKLLSEKIIFDIIDYY